MQNELNNAFAKLNEEIATRQMDWASARRDAVKAKAEELAPMRLQMGEWAYYDKMFAVAGGKTWYAILTQYDWAVLVRKNTEALIAKRDANITKALKKAGITEIPAFDLLACKAIARRFRQALST